MPSPSEIRESQVGICHQVTNHRRKEDGCVPAPLEVTLNIQNDIL